MSITRLSAGVYTNGTNTVKGQSSLAAATQALGGASATPAQPAQPAPPTYDLSTPQSAFNANLNANNQTAEQQSQYNRVNETGTFGSATYGTDANGNTTRDFSLSDNQSLINQQREQQDINLGHTANNLVNNAYGDLSQSYNLDGAPKILSESDLLTERKRVEDDLYGQFTRRIDPEFEKQTSDLEQRLAERGIPVGSEASLAAMERLRQNQGDARLDAQSEAVRLGGDELTRNYGLSADRRDRYVNEYEKSRGASLADLGSIYNLQRGVQQQPFSGTSQINLPSASLADLGLQYQSLENQRISASNGSPTDPFALARLQAELGETAAQNDFDRSLLLADSQNQSTSFGDIAGALGGSLVGGLAQGIGSSFNFGI